MIVALAGRRIDAADADTKRFPLSNVEKVEQRIRDYMQSNGVSALVSSAACGADLLALKVARETGVQRRVILPAPVAEFRETSVIDRPGDWGPLYDRVIAEVQRDQALIILDKKTAGKDPYAAVNLALLDEAAALAARTHDNATAVLVWEGESRGPGDMTQQFGDEARRRRLPVTGIPTL